MGSDQQHRPRDSGPWLLLIVLGLFGGTFAIGTPELMLVWLCWLIGIPTVAVLWYRKYVAGP